MQVRREINQITDERILSAVDEFRDALGEIDKGALSTHVSGLLCSQEPWLVAEVQAGAMPAYVNERIRTVLRQTQQPAKKPGISGTTAERAFVSFPGPDGEIVSKHRSDLTKAEIPYYRAYHERFRKGHDREITWCDAVWQQMELLNCADDTPVSAIGF